METTTNPAQEDDQNDTRPPSTDQPRRPPAKRRPSARVFIIPRESSYHIVQSVRLFHGYTERQSEERKKSISLSYAWTLVLPERGNAQHRREFWFLSDTGLICSQVPMLCTEYVVLSLHLCTRPQPCGVRQTALSSVSKLHILPVCENRKAPNSVLGCLFVSSCVLRYAGLLYLATSCCSTVQRMGGAPSS